MDTLNFGVEFEFVGMGQEKREIGMALHNAINVGSLPQISFSWGGTSPTNWFVKGDTSVQRTDHCSEGAQARCGRCNFCLYQGGAEVVSPILSYDEDGLMQVYRICEALVACGAFTNETCGFHVHFDARWLRNYPREFSNDFLSFLAKSYANDELLFDEFVSSTRKADNNRYCRSLCNVSDYLSADRYHKLNIQAFPRHGTVEFRHHHGTVDHKEALNWIALCAKYYIDKRIEFLYEARQNRNYLHYFRTIESNFNSFT